MISEKSAMHMKKYGWSKSRRIDIRKKYKYFFNDFINDAKFAEFTISVSKIENFIAEFCDLEFYHPNNIQDYACITLKYISPGSVDSIYRLSKHLGNFTFVIGHAFSEETLYINVDGVIYLGMTDEKCLALIGSTWNGIDNLLEIDFRKPIKKVDISELME